MENLAMKPNEERIQERIPEPIYEIVGRPPVSFKGYRGGRGEIGMMIASLCDEISKTIETGDALRIRIVGKRGHFLSQLRNGLKRRGYAMDWSRYGADHVDIWALPLKPTE
jgi:hypothetical protein